MKMPFFIVSLTIGLALSACDEFPFHPDGEKKPDSPSDSVEAVRTPDERFEGLAGYAFEPHYVTVMPGHLRMHYLDEGPADGPLVLLLHGNPTWTYLVRDMVPTLVNQGYHVIAPDLIGFGRSDKPLDREMHTYDNQEAWVTSFVNELNLQHIHAHLQDWGGLIGLRVAVRNEDRFATVAISNTGLPIGEDLGEAFTEWQDSISQIIPSYGLLLQQASLTALTPDELAAYDAPFPSEEYKAAPRELPQRVPSDPSDPEAIENRRLLEDEWSRWEKPFIILSGDSEENATTVGSSDQTTLSSADSLMISIVPGAAGQPHALIKGAGHFVQEDAPEELTERLIDFIESSR